MTKLEMLAMVRKIINDEQATGFTEGGNLEEPEGTQELLTYLDRAVDEYSKRQAGAHDLRLVKRMTVNNGANLPSDFISFCGQVPITLEGKVMNYYGYATNYTVRYFARLPYITSYSDTAVLPYDTDQANTIMALAAIYALNKHEYNVSQDLMLLGYGAQNGNAQQ